MREKRKVPVKLFFAGLFILVGVLGEFFIVEWINPDQPGQIHSPDPCECVPIRGRSHAKCTRRSMSAAVDQQNHATLLIF
jgi:hypothetical protein